MIHKIDKGDYYLIKSDSGKKFMVKGKGDMVYSQATELKDKPREYIEVDEWLLKLNKDIKLLVRLVNHFQNQT